MLHRDQRNRCDRFDPGFSKERESSRYELLWKGSSRSRAEDDCSILSLIEDQRINTDIGKVGTWCTPSFLALIKSGQFLSLSPISV